MYIYIYIYIYMHSQKNSQGRLQLEILDYYLKQSLSVKWKKCLRTDGSKLKYCISYLPWNELNVLVSNCNLWLCELIKLLWRSLILWYFWPHSKHKQKPCFDWTYFTKIAPWKRCTCRLRFDVSFVWKEQWLHFFIFSLMFLSYFVVSFSSVNGKSTKVTSSSSLFVTTSQSLTFSICNKPQSIWLLTNQDITTNLIINRWTGKITEVRHMRKIFSPCK